MPPKPLMNASKYGDLWTPKEAWLPMGKFLYDNCRWVSKIWEPAFGSGQLSQLMNEQGYTVHPTKDDFLTYKFGAIPADCIVTNPPYSLKFQFMERALEIGLPFAFLLPITTLGTARAQKVFAKQRFDLILLPKRIDFTGKKAPWFAVAWFCCGFEGEGIQWPT